MKQGTLFCISVLLFTIVSALAIETNAQSPASPGDIEASLKLEGEADSESDPHHCVWYDKCGPDPDYQDNVHNLNCVYQGKAGQLTF